MEDWDAAIFLCNPLSVFFFQYRIVSATVQRTIVIIFPFVICRINNLEDMDELGLHLNDLSLHGHGREMAMAGWQHNSRFLHHTSTFVRNVW